MADSDEEHDRNRGRDKFRKERSDYGDKSRSRGDYRDRRTWRENREVLCFTYRMIARAAIEGISTVVSLSLTGGEH